MTLKTNPPPPPPSNEDLAFIEALKRSKLALRCTSMSLMCAEGAHNARQSLERQALLLGFANGLTDAGHNLARQSDEIAANPDQVQTAIQTYDQTEKTVDALLAHAQNVLHPPDPDKKH